MVAGIWDGWLIICGRGSMAVPGAPGNRQRLPRPARPLVGGNNLKFPATLYTSLVVAGHRPGGGIGRSSMVDSWYHRKTCVWADGDGTAKVA